MGSTDNGGRFMEASPSIGGLSRTGSQTISIRSSGSPVANKSTNNANRSGPNAISTASKTLAFGNNNSNKVPANGSGGDEGANVSTNCGGTQSGKQSTNTGPGLQGAHNSLLRIGPRLRAEGLMVPPASDAATLRRQVAGLQSDLEAHIESEQRLQTINQQLRERLELYMKQNHENVERAENELNTLHEEMEQTLELQRRLAQRASSLEKEKKDLEQSLQKRVQEFEVERAALQKQIVSLSEDVHAQANAQARADALQIELECTLQVKAKLEKEIQNCCAEAELLKKKAHDCSEELRALIAKEQMNNLVEKCAKRPSLRRFFHRFLRGIEEQRLARNSETIAITFANAKCCKHGFQILYLATSLARHIRLAQACRAKVCLQESWRAWRSITLAHKKYFVALQNRDKSCVSKSFRKWRSLLEVGKLSEEEEQRLNALAKQYWTACISKRALRQWMEFIESFARPRKTKVRDIQVQLDRLTCRQAMAAWKCAIRAKRVMKIKLQQASIKGKIWLQKRSFYRWLDGLYVQRMKRESKENALQLRRFCLCRISVKCWYTYLHMRNHKKISVTIAFRHYLRNLQRQVIGVWKHNVRFQRVEVKATIEANQALMRAAMVLWKDFHLLSTIRSKKERIAYIHWKRKERKIARSSLQIWWEQMTKKRRALQLEHLLVARRRHSLLVISLHCWMHSTFDNLLVSNAKFHNELLEVKAQYEEQKQQTTAVDVENLQLIDRLHTMSAEISSLKKTIEQKEKEDEEMHRALEDGAVIESSLRGELEQQHIRMEELELEILSLQKKLQMKNAEDTAGEVHHTLEIQNLEQALKDLQTQLAGKTEHLESYEMALKETSEKLEGASDESHEQLSNAFEIGSSLRKLLEDRENEYATLEGNCHRKEMELGEIQRKLAAANSTFSETVEARDLRIQELENMLAQKQAEVNETHQELQELQLELDARDNLIRKLEYDIKLKSDQDTYKTKTFVSSLSSWPVAHCEASSSLRNNVQSLHLKESMRNVYTQAKAEIQQGANPEGGDITYNASSSLKGQGKPSVHWDATASYDDQQEHESPDEEMPSPKNSIGLTEESSLTNLLDKTAHLVSEKNDSEGSTSMVNSLQSYNAPGQGSVQANWESSFAPYSSANRPNESSHSLNELELERASEGNGPTKQSDSQFPVLEETPVPVDNLQVEIQRLQARIMSRLRDSPTQCEERSRGHRPQQGGSSAFLTSLPNLKHR